MKRVLLSLAVALLLPGMLSAATMGAYFSYTPGAMSASPAVFTTFDVYLFVHNADAYVTAVEYQLATPTDPTHVFFAIGAVEYPDNKAVNLGDPFSGHSISYWPPLNGYTPGYNLLCSFPAFLTEPCWNEGGLVSDYLLVIGPHPDSGELRGTYSPDNEFFDIIGLTSLLCPSEIATESSSWGAIKSLAE